MPRELTRATRAAMARLPALSRRALGVVTGLPLTAGMLSAACSRYADPLPEGTLQVRIDSLWTPADPPKALRIEYATGPEQIQLVFVRIPRWLRISSTAKELTALGDTFTVSRGSTIFFDAQLRDIPSTPASYSDTLLLESSLQSRNAIAVRLTVPDPCEPTNLPPAKSFAVDLTGGACPLPSGAFGHYYRLHVPTQSLGLYDSVATQLVAVSTEVYPSLELRGTSSQVLAFKDAADSTGRAAYLIVHLISGDYTFLARGRRGERGSISLGRDLREPADIECAYSWILRGENMRRTFTTALCQDSGQGTLRPIARYFFAAVPNQIVTVTLRPERGNGMDARLTIRTYQGGDVEVSPMDSSDVRKATFTPKAEYYLLEVRDRGAIARRFTLSVE
jgi:hypothetical protein